MVGYFIGKWLMVGGMWSVAGRLSVVLYYAIKTFGVEITQWTPFYDSIKSSIDLNPDTPETDKFNYLLCGSAYEAIE